MGIDFKTGAPVGIKGFEPWIHGHAPGRPATDPPIQVQQHDEHTFVLRQSKDSDYEGPFLYLLFGQQRAFLFDTGATADPQLFPLREVVDRLIQEWCTDHDIAAYELVVAHSHSHGDHIAGDGQFTGRENTRIQGVEVAQVVDFYGFGDDIDATVEFDLGGRRLELLRIPGHDAASIAIHDPWTGWLLTGDTVYPGRLYVEDPLAFQHSLTNLVALAVNRKVTAVMGCHIEMSSEPGVDYPTGTTWQPDEAPLAMNVDQLREIERAAHLCARPGRHVFDTFILVPETTS